MFALFSEAPRCEVYNVGGGRTNSLSILEAFERITALTGRRMEYEYLDEHREGDHMCYISDLKKMRGHYPGWNITKNLDHIFAEIYAASIQKSTL